MQRRSFAPWRVSGVLPARTTAIHHEGTPMSHLHPMPRRAHVPNGIPPGFDEPPPSPMEPDTPIELPHEPPPDVIEPPVPTEWPPVQEPPAQPVVIRAARRALGASPGRAYRLPLVWH